MNHGSAPEPSPAPERYQRSYAVPYRLVWSALLQVVEHSRGWQLVRADPRSGEVDVELRGGLLRSPRSARVRVSLDQFGGTAVAVFHLDKAGNAAALRSRRSARFLRRLDRALEPGGGTDR